MFRTCLATILLVLAGCASPALPGAPPVLRWVPGRVLVKFRDDAPSARVKEARIRVGAQTWEELPLGGAEAISLDGSVDVPAALERLGDYEDVVEYAEPDFLYDTSGTPSDYDPDLLWGLAAIDAPEAWMRTEGTSDVVVAVLDTGIDTAHADLQSNLWRNFDEDANGLDDDGDGFVDDVLGWNFVDGTPDVMDHDSHGTHVAGTIAAVGGNGGIVGVAPGVRLMPLKVLGPEGGRASDIVKAIAFARARGVQVINASWGGRGDSRALEEAIRRAGESGIFVVAAAGNGDGNGLGENADEAPTYPAAYGLPNVVAVAASDRYDRLASFSNYGPRTVDLAAPGVGIVSTVPGNGYAGYDGTSMAAPHVAGALALLVCAEPDLDMDLVKQALLDSVKKVPSMDGRLASGGRLDLPAALSDAHDLATQRVVN